MNRLRLFLENFLVYGLGGIISKAVPLIMIPIVTRIMPSSKYFGISDLANTLVSLASAFAILGMYDAMYRLFFEKEDIIYKKKICSTTLAFTIALSLITSLIMFALRDVIAAFFFNDSKLAYVIYITAIATFVGATNGIVAAPTRMQNKRAVFLVMNSLSPIIAYSISLFLLLKGYYIIALPLGTLISGICSELIFFILNYQWFSFKYVELKSLKELLWIAIPLFPNFIIYWIFNSSDRVMITNMLGVAEAGLYAVGSKLGAVSQLIYLAFAGGWQYFSFSTMRANDQVQVNSLIFEYLGIISFLCTFFICLFAKPLYQLLFTMEYTASFIIAPYLFLAPLLQMLFQIGSNQFLIVKKTWPNFFILCSGAIINVVLNYYLIPYLGIEGAAIATLTGYIIADVICVIVLSKMRLMQLSKRFFLVILLSIGYFILWRTYFIESFFINFFTNVIYVSVLIKIYYRPILRIVKSRG